MMAKNFLWPIGLKLRPNVRSAEKIGFRAVFRVLSSVPRSYSGFGPILDHFSPKINMLIMIRVKNLPLDFEWVPVVGGSISEYLIFNPHIPQDFFFALFPMRWFLEFSGPRRQLFWPISGSEVFKLIIWPWLL